MEEGGGGGRGGFSGEERVWDFVGLNGGDREG